MPFKSDHLSLIEREDGQNLYRYKLSIEETDGIIISDKATAIRDAVKQLEKSRDELQRYLRKNPNFNYSLKPVEATSDAPAVAKKMCEAAYKANVGPMAAVAGALSDLAFTQMMEAGANVAIIENGGEAIVTSNTPVYAGIFAGPSQLSGKLALKLSHFPTGVATSSASVGKAFTFGSADAATIITDNASLADAAATAVCNAVQGHDYKKSIKKGLSAAKMIEGVKAAIVIRGNYIGSTGEVPELVKVKGDFTDAIITSLEGKRAQVGLEQLYTLASIIHFESSMFLHSQDAPFSRLLPLI